VAGPVV